MTRNKERKRRRDVGEDDVSDDEQLALTEEEQVAKRNKAIDDMAAQGQKQTEMMQMMVQ